MKTHPRRGLTFVDLIVAMTILALASVVMVPRLAVRSKDISNRVRCAANLKSLGQALLLYANDNNGNYPRTRYDGDHPTPTEYTGANASNPFGAGGPSVNDVTAPLFLLIRGDYTTPGVCICPSDPSAQILVLKGSSWASISNFADNKGLSYSVQNAYPSKEAIADGFVWKNTLGSDFAVLADMNPGTPDVLKVTLQSTFAQVKTANSPNHQQDGQEVLFGDGHVDLFMTPFCGASFDNIYGASKPRDPSTLQTDPMVHKINGPPMHKDDTVLLPTYTGAVRAHEAPSQGVTEPMLYAGCGAVIVGTIIVMVILSRRANRRLRELTAGTEGSAPT